MQSCNNKNVVITCIYNKTNIGKCSSKHRKPSSDWNNFIYVSRQSMGHVDWWCYKPNVTHNKNIVITCVYWYLSPIKPILENAHQNTENLQVIGITSFMFPDKVL